MKKLLIKIGLLVFLTLLLNIVLNKAIYSRLTPFYWGSPLIKNKYDAIKSENNYNVLFIGSSKTRVQINTHLFDSVVNHGAGDKFKSLNFGINSLLPPESFFLYENLLENNDLDKFEYVVFELGHIGNPHFGNLHKKRTMYSMDFDNYSFTLRALWESNRSVLMKAYSTAGYSINHIDNVINLGIVDEISKFQSNTMFDDDAESLEEIIRNKGFTQREDTVLTNAAYQELSNRLHNLQSISSQYFEMYESNNTEVKNKALLDLANKYIELSKKHGVHLIFAFTRQWNDYQYMDLIPVFQKIPPEHKIIFADSRQLPDLFSVEYSNDYSHLNSKGSKILTTYIASQFENLVANREKAKKAEPKNLVDRTKF